VIARAQVGVDLGELDVRPVVLVAPRCAALAGLRVEHAPAQLHRVLAAMCSRLPLGQLAVLLARAQPRARGVYADDGSGGDDGEVVARGVAPPEPAVLFGQLAWHAQPVREERRALLGDGACSS